MRIQIKLIFSDFIYRNRLEFIQNNSCNPQLPQEKQIEALFFVFTTIITLMKIKS